MIPKVIHYNIVPPLFVVVFTLAAQVLAVLGGTEDADWSLVGTSFSWAVVGTMSLWALASQWGPGKIYKGPETPFGFVPEYKANGFQYFIASTLCLTILLVIKPEIVLEITGNFPQIIASCSLMALILCLYLLIQGRYFPQSNEKMESFPIIYEFYRGMELHPRLLGVDVKQFTNCRFGLMAWQLLNMIFFYHGYLKYGFSTAAFASVFLQTVYLGKFYWWETGYFNTPDITYDRAGYYICWGCLVWVPILFTFVCYFLANRPPLVDSNWAFVIILFGLSAIALNYRVDWEKEYFRANKGKCTLWNKSATYLKASYKTQDGKVKHSLLLTSGFWGKARHMNYFFEMCVAISWSLPTLGYGLLPWLYPIFIIILLLHRLMRDEEKCLKKYGEKWIEYCKLVSYRLIPGVF